MRAVRKYDKEFRINAVKHYESSGRKITEVAESFFHTLKTKHVYQNTFDTTEEAKRSLFDYIEIFYNRQRAHSFLGYLSPEEFEKNWSKQAI